MLSKSNAINDVPAPALPAWGISAAIHLVLAGVIASFLYPFWSAEEPRTAEFEVYEAPKVSSQAISLLKKPQPKAEAKEKKRAVFGASRKSVTSESGLDVKTGNTVAKAPDDERLRPGDEDSLPVPVDEYMVNQMPQLLAEVRIPYPPEAQKAKVEGPVVMDLLIDESGRVREVRLIEGPGYGLNEAAVTAARDFRFKPGQVEQKAVAVRIRYSYRFVLQR